VVLGALEVDFLRGEERLALISIAARLPVDIRVTDEALEVSVGDPQVWLTKVDGGIEFGEREMNIFDAYLQTALPNYIRDVLHEVPIPAQYGTLLNAPGFTVADGYVFFGDDPLP
jgi:hypothetical protein